MRARPFVRREGTGFSVRFVGAQRDLLGEVLPWLTHRREGEPALTVRAGCGKERLEQLSATLQGAETVVLSAEDLHILHSVLLSAYSMFASDEAFHVQLGFFRENALALAQGLALAVEDAASQD
ncbi:hypothetical protein [Streptomyces sp. NPDC058614]|uniref:hypothetical protein n=1 Tax=Streptomyces sp. NPDC058614 TaxID=3346557 RepID=UPI003657D033